MVTAETFWDKVDGSGDCWLWTGTQVGRAGEKYGQARWNGASTPAHRIAYEILVGPIQTGRVLDHLCRNHLCVNPDHLEPVTQRANILRGYGATAKAARRTTCVRGHPLTSEGSRRRCVECAQASHAARFQATYVRHPRNPATHCSKGHPRTPENLGAGTNCLICKAAWMRAYNQRKREVAA